MKMPQGRFQCLKSFLIVLLIVQMTACGTLLYPERRGQKTGQIDVGVAILDGIGLLFFIVPGVVAFAVDFSTGAIFLPSGINQSPLFHTPQKRAGLFSVVYVDPKDLDRLKIEAVIAKHTGHAISLNHPDFVVTKLKNEAALLEAYQAWTAVKKGPTTHKRQAKLALKD